MININSPVGASDSEYRIRFYEEISAGISSDNTYLRPDDTKKKFKINLDKIGFSASFLCAIHCAFLPMIITTLSLSQLEFLTNPLIELGIILFSIIIGTASLLPGYLKHHKKISPVIFIVLGFMIILGGHLFVDESFEHIVTPFGAMLVAFAHILNWKYFSNHQHEEAHA